MSLIEENHTVELSKKNGVKLYFAGMKSPITIPMPNYHLFASQVKDGDNTLHKKKSSNNKQSINLDLLYRRLGCRSVKTLLSANQADVWDDSYITVQNDIISASDHHIATIRK